MSATYVAGEFVLSPVQQAMTVWWYIQTMSLYLLVHEAKTLEIQIARRNKVTRPWRHKFMIPFPDYLPSAKGSRG